MQHILRQEIQKNGPHGDTWNSPTGGRINWIFNKLRILNLNTSPEFAFWTQTACSFPFAPPYLDVTKVEHPQEPNACPRYISISRKRRMVSLLKRWGVNLMELSSRNLSDAETESSQLCLSLFSIMLFALTRLQVPSSALVR